VHGNHVQCGPARACNALFILEGETLVDAVQLEETVHLLCPTPQHEGVVI
jgi:hypothetical protein